MPDLGELNGPNPKRQHVVDHGFIQAENGQWQLWACIRGTAVSRLLYGWRGKSLEAELWEPIGVVARAQREYGEQVGTKDGHVVEAIGAPYFKIIGDTYYCFYHSGGMRAMTSQNGVNYQRADFGENRGNLLFPNGGRDIMIAKFGDLYYAYSTVTTADRKCHIELRTSPDLLSWSKPKIVSQGGKAGNDHVSAESPFVVEMDGYYYLFRASSMTFLTYVYRSPHPTDFGIEDDKYLIAEFHIKAPELVHHQGQWYISDLHSDLHKGVHNFQGIRIAKLQWEVEE